MSMRPILASALSAAIVALTPRLAGAQERPATSPAMAVADPSIVATTLSLSPLQRASPAPLALGSDPGASSVVVGFAPLVFAWRGIEVAASAGAMRDASGVGATWTLATASRNFGALRLTTTVRASHVLASGRDPLDVMVVAGATYRLHGALRAGIEYVGQDIESGLDDDKDGGARHFIGPVVAIDLPGRLALAAGPAVSLTPTAAPGSTPIVARLGLGYAF